MVGQRGFSTIELLVATAIFAGLVVATASTFGARPNRLHADALALQAAVVEARSLAFAMSAGSPDPTLAEISGATVTVAPDVALGRGSLISVFRSRPIPQAAMPSPDRGFPPVHVDSIFAVSDRANGASAGPFAILISSSGPASIARAYPTSPGAFARLTTDPGCDDSGTTIDVTTGAFSESHAFACRDAIYDASSHAT